MQTRRSFLLITAAALSACGRRSEPAATRAADIPLYPNETPQLRALINKYAGIHDIPVTLLHRVIIRTARTMGYRGSPEGLLDAETNLKYAGKYLRGAWLVSDGDEATAVSWYARGYYFEAKRRGLLVETGLRPG